MDAPNTEHEQDSQEITAWEKTDDALAAAAELMPVCPAGDGDEGEPAAEGDA
jgi:hypothetical protein